MFLRIYLLRLKSNVNRVLLIGNNGMHYFIFFIPTISNFVALLVFIRQKRASFHHQAAATTLLLREQLSTFLPRLRHTKGVQMLLMMMAVMTVGEKKNWFSLNSNHRRRVIDLLFCLFRVFLLSHNWLVVGLIVVEMEELSERNAALRRRSPCRRCCW